MTEDEEIAKAKELSCAHYEIKPGLEDAWWRSREYRAHHYWRSVANGSVEAPEPAVAGKHGRHWRQTRRGFEA